jgi:hypothetical protein
VLETLWKVLPPGQGLQVLQGDRLVCCPGQGWRACLQQLQVSCIQQRTVLQLQAGVAVIEGSALLRKGQDRKQAGVTAAERRVSLHANPPVR